MQLHSACRLGKKHCGMVHLADGSALYVSYRTIVGVRTREGVNYFTDERFSVTTSHHATALGPGARLDAERFADLVESMGFDAGYNRAPVSFGGNGKVRV